MAKDELREITEDSWDDEIWGASVPDTDSPRTKLIFYFGKKDHWVANHIRDDLIRARAFKEDQPDSLRPKMLVDNDGIPHAFCTGELQCSSVDLVPVADCWAT